MGGCIAWFQHRKLLAWRIFANAEHTCGSVFLSSLKTPNPTPFPIQKRERDCNCLEKRRLFAQREREEFTRKFCKGTTTYLTCIYHVCWNVWSILIYTRNPKIDSGVVLFQALLGFYKFLLRSFVKPSSSILLFAVKSDGSLIDLATFAINFLKISAFCTNCSSDDHLDVHYGIY